MAIIRKLVEDNNVEEKMNKNDTGKGRVVKVVYSGMHYYWK